MRLWVIFSSNLEKHGRRLIGQKLAMLLGSSFLKIGTTLAVLKQLMYTPWEYERLKMYAKPSSILVGIYLITLRGILS